MLSGRSDQDFQHRENGKMALRILNRADLGMQQQLSTFTLDVGTRVAIIDLRVFVPEVVSVLSTIADPTLSEQLSQIPFIGRLIGQDPISPVEPITLGTSFSEAILQSVAQSEIDTIRRLPAKAKAKLSSEITSLMSAANLDGTQLEAFSSGLTQSVHCTQGPPGTGKVFHNAHTYSKCCDLVM